MTFLGNIHSSFRRPVHLAAASLLLSFALFATRSLPAAAQRFEKTVERNAWNLTSNVCGVRADSVSISQAQLYGRYTDGGFHDLSDPAPEPFVFERCRKVQLARVDNAV